MRTRAQTPARILAIAAALLGLALSATGCNAGRPPAASVEGRDVSSERIDQIVAAYYEADPDQFGEQVRGAGDGTFRMDAVSAILNTILIQMVQSELADREGAEPTEEERSQAADLLETFFVPQAAPSEDPTAEPTEEQTQAQQDSLAIFEAIPTDTQEWLIDLRADSLALARVVGATDEELAADAQEVFEADPSAYADRYCLRAIVVGPDDLPAVQERLAGGEDFGALSAEVSIDQQTAQSRGELGQCVPTDQLESAGLAPEVLALVQPLEVGDVSAPFALDDATVAIFERRAVAFTDVQQEIVATLPPGGEAAVAALVRDEIDSIEVSIDPRFGTWDSASGTVIPPDGAHSPEVSTDLVDATSTDADTETDGDAGSGAATSGASSDPAAGDPTSTSVPTTEG